MLTLFAGWGESQSLGSCRASKLSKAILFVTPPDVSGLPSSKVSACSSIIKDTVEARPGGKMEQSLLKQNLTP